MERVSLIFPLVQQLEQEYESLRKRFQQLEGTVFQKDKQILLLQKDIQHEKSTTTIYSQLLLKYFPNITIPETQEEKSEPAIKSKKSIKKSAKKSRFVPIKSAPEEDKKETEEKRIKQEEFVQLLSTKDYTAQTKIVRDLIESLSSERTAKKNICENIKKARKELLKHTSLQEYMKILEIHNLRLKELFTQKKWNLDNLSKTLNSLDSYLLLSNGFQKVSLIVDDIEPLRESISLFLEYDKTYVVFNLSDIFKKIVGQALAFLPLQEVLRYAFDNPYGYNNLVYVCPKEKNDSETDLFSFFSLRSISISKDGSVKRKWSQELRLEILSKTIADKICSYCCDYFRKIYFRAFGSNCYQDDFLQTAVGSVNCSYLLRTIALCRQAKSFCNLLRETVAKYCTLHPVAADNFNMRSDDTYARGEFNKNCINNREEVISAFYTLFENPNDKDIEDLTDTIVSQITEEVKGEEN